MSKKKMKKRKILGSMDSYHQARISLEDSDISKLEKNGELIGKMWVSSPDIEDEPGKDYGLAIYLCEEYPPIGDEIKPLVDNQYQMYIDRRSLQLVKEGRLAGAGAHPDERGFYRQIIITKEGVL